MPTDANPDFLTVAMTALCESPVSVDRIVTEESSKPGLYAVYASASTWHDLGLGKPPDSRPLYVGKAENTLAARDVEGHFGMAKRAAQSPTGSSTLRRSPAALGPGPRVSGHSAQPCKAPSEASSPRRVRSLPLPFALCAFGD